MKNRLTVGMVSAIFALVIFLASHVKTYSQTFEKNGEPMKMKCEIRGKGTPILLVPGGLTGWVSWKPHAEALSGKRTAIRVQLLNVQFGLEDRPLPGDYSVKTESEALRSTLDSLGYTEPIDVAGWSFGAYIALQFSLDNPGRIRTLTLIEPPAIWALRASGKVDKEAQRQLDFLQTLNGDITEDMLAEFLQTAGFLAPGQSARELPQWNNWLGYRRSLRNSSAVVNHEDDINRLRHFKVPTLLVKGTGSSVWLHDIIGFLDEHIPNSRVVEFPGGHAPHLVSMEEFMIALQTFQAESGK